MRAFHNIIARTLIWLAAITLPVQAIPAASCGCTSSTNWENAERTASCSCSEAKVLQGTCCCSRKASVPRASCCSNNRPANTTRCCCNQTDSGCNCGMTCQCGKGKQPTPAAPPVENHSSDSLACDSLLVSPIATPNQPHVTRRQDDSSSVSDALAALDRCVSLCRFTI